MDWKEFFRPTKAKIILFVILYLLLASFIWMMGSACCEMLVKCVDKPGHAVPSYFPGAMCCAVCATQSELILGYVIMILTYYALPAVILYVLLSLIFYVGRTLKK
jgi:hypothetical protein